MKFKTFAAIKLTLFASWIGGFSTQAHSQSYREHQTAPEISVYINPLAPGVTQTENDTWDFSPSDGSFCIDSHFWTKLYGKGGLVPVKTAENSTRIFKRVARELQHNVRFSHADFPYIGPHVGTTRCAFTFVPSTFTERNSNSQFQDPNVIPSYLVLAGKISVKELLKSLTSGETEELLPVQPVPRKKGQRELPQGMSYDFYDNGGRWHGDKMYTPIFQGATWRDANAFCNGLTFAGVSGWRLPTFENLRDFSMNSSKEIPRHSEILQDRSHYAHFDGVRIWTSTSQSSESHVAVLNRIKENISYVNGKMGIGGVQNDRDFNRLDRSIHGVACVR